MPGGNLLAILLACCTHAASDGAAAPQVPSVFRLRNGVLPGAQVLLPAVGLGTYGYGAGDLATPDEPCLGNVTNGECWDNKMVQPVVTEWLARGGRRIDGASDYLTQYGVGAAIEAFLQNRDELTREDLFLTSKVMLRGAGPANMSTFDWVLAQFDTITDQLRTNYTDLLLIHWAGDAHHANSSASNCGECTIAPAPGYGRCRQEAWAALQQLLREKRTRSIGVSNFNRTHIEEMLTATGSEVLPAVNQVEHHPYWHEEQLREWCSSKGIALQGYSPLGAMDYMSWHRVRWPLMPTEQPAVKAIAKAVGRTPAQVLLRWSLQRNVSVNPRTRGASASTSRTHMAENLALFDFSLTAEQMVAVDGIAAAAGAPPRICGAASKAIDPALGREWCVQKVCPDPGTIR